MRTLTLATRGSALALAQADIVKHALEEAGAAAEVLVVSTKGDRDRTSPLTQIGGNGLFVREVERAVLEGRADLAVHSGKDLPYELAEGLVIAGVPKAAAPNDLLVARKGVPVQTIGTGSPRRQAEVGRLYPNAAFVPVRGNVPTRLQKLADGEFDALVLAQAGADRLGLDLSSFDVRVLTVDECIPAPCQGILAVECRKTDTELAALLEQISDPDSAKRFRVERQVFEALKADCSKAVAVHCELQGDILVLSALFGEKRVTVTGTEEETLCQNVLRALTAPAS